MTTRCKYHSISPSRCCLECIKINKWKKCIGGHHIKGDCKNTCTDCHPKGTVFCKGGLHLPGHISGCHICREFNGR